MEPHRGTTVLVLGILGIALCYICGPIAWVMANKDNWASKMILLGGKSIFLQKAADSVAPNFAVHGAVFPFDAQRAAVLDVVEGADDELEVDLATADGLEVPVAAGLVEIDVAAEDAGGAVADAPGATSFMWTWKMRSLNL
jgi:hypothetical protein